MTKKNLNRKLFTVLFTLFTLLPSSVMLMSVCRTVAPTSAESDTISVTYPFDESEILNWLDTKQFMKSLRVLSLAGEPLTPYRVTKILLPPNAEVAHVSVYGKVGGQRIVKDIPCGQPPAIIGEEPTIVGKNSDVYNSDEPYPGEIYRVGSVKSFRGYNILNVRLYPVQYKPVSKLATHYTEMTIDITLKTGNKRDTFRNLVKDKEIVASLVDNPSVLSTYDSTLVATETLGTTYEYIVVTTPDLADEFQVLADWKACFVDGATVVTVNEGANATVIKDVIDDYYTNYGTSYVLLGGDVGVIPYHTCFVSMPAAYADIAEDYWFANLDGDDEISYYEVYIGRAPVDNDTEAENFVNKVIAYEQMPKPKANLFTQSRLETQNVPDSRELAYQCEQYVPLNYINYELFEENGRIEKTDWINFWCNDGIMCEHIGHGKKTYYCINHEVGAGEVRWYNTDVASMNNTFWPVHTSAACLSGAFEYEDCLAEAYVKDPDNGAIACLMNDNYGVYSLCDATKPSGDFIEMQFKGLYQEGYENIGAMLAYSKHCFIDEATNTSDPDQSAWEWCWREINLIGDPETPLLTTRAQTVNVIKNSGWETGDNVFWNVSTTQEPNSAVYYEVNQDSACFGSYGFHVSMETDSNKPRYTNQSLMESQSLSKAMLDTNTKLKYRIYPAYELYGVSKIPEARWEIILFFSTGNKLHYYGSLNMEPTENSTDKYVYVPITLDQWNKFFDKTVLETYAGKFGTPPTGTTITKIAAYVTSKTYAKGKKFNRVIANFDSDEVTEGLQYTLWYVKNVHTGLVYDTIQKAIDANETKDGHTISVKGKYHEHVVVNKSLTLMGQDPWTTIIDGNGTGNVVTIKENNVRISQFTIQNGKTGIYLEYSNYTSVSSNTVSNNSDIGIYLYRCINSSVSGNTVLDNRNPISGSGIVIQNDISNSNMSMNVGDNSVTGNIVSGSEHGIWLLLSNDNLVSSNTVSNNSDYGIYVYRSRYNNITENHVPNNDYAGIYLYSSPYNDITANQVSNNNYYGINLYASLDNTIYHNNFINNTDQATTSGLANVWDDGYPSSGNYWSDYTSVDQCRGPDQNETGSDGIWDHPYTIDANNRDRYPLVNPWTPTRTWTWTVDDDGPADFHTIQEAINAANSGDTIYVYNGTYYEHIIVNKYNLTLIGENRNTTIIDGNGTGNVVTIKENNVRISQFTIQNGDCGVYLEYSISGIVSNNTVSNNYYGIYLAYCCSNIVSNNTVSNNERGIYLLNMGKHSVTGNKVLDNSNFGISLDKSDNNFVSGNTVSNNTEYGIILGMSWDNKITENEISNNTEYGINLYRSYNTKITENEISNNKIGLRSYFPYPSEYTNTIHHNNFINNTEKQASVEGYLYVNTWNSTNLVGNYWSDYSGTDSDGDGIGDTPYPIPENNQDNYPLMWKWFPGDLDGDGDVDEDDFMWFVDAMYTQMGDPHYNKLADLDYDCDVDDDDYDIFIENYPS